MGEVRNLFRPVGLLELERILDSECRAFPPRLPEQPIFYPVLNREYAEQIARDWNPSDARSGHAGFVTDFEVEASHLDRFEVKTVGANRHQELWIPAEELGAFNAKLKSRIRVTQAFYGDAYLGPRPLPTVVRAANPREQLSLFHASFEYNRFDFVLEVSANWRLVLANHAFWSVCPPEQQGLSVDAARAVLSAIAVEWDRRFPDLPLPQAGALKPAGG